MISTLNDILKFMNAVSRKSFKKKAFRLFSPM